MTEREEKELVGVYSFVSKGAHTAAGMTEEEMARLGRNLAAGMAYFPLRRHLG
jgi:hypothetical protein